MKRKVSIVLLLLLLLLSKSVLAWDSYNYVDGLIDNKVTAVAVSQEMVFCGTPLGGSRFDGARWENFLEGVEITKIVLDKDEHVWVGTRQGVWEGHDEKWIPSLSDVAVNDIVIDDKDKIWVATSDGLRTSNNGSDWKDYKHLDEQLIQDGRDFVVSMSEINSSDELVWKRTYLTALALGNESELYAGIHIVFQVAEDKELLIFSGIGTLDSYRWKLLEPTLEVRMLGFLEKRFGSLEIEFIDSAFKACIYKEKCLYEKPISLNIWDFLYYTRPVIDLSVESNGDIWYSRWRKGIFRTNGEDKPQRFWSQDIDGNGIWDGRQEALAAVDLDRDGKKELIATARAGYDLEPRGIYAYDAESGEEKWQYRIGPIISPSGCIAVGDVTGNFKLEVVAGGGNVDNGVEANGTDDSHAFLFILNHRGVNLWGDGISKPLTDAGGGLNVAISDIDGDEVNEIVGGISWNDYVFPEVTNAGVIVSDGRGNIEDRYIHPNSTGNIGVADLDGKGTPEIIFIDSEKIVTVLDSELSVICKKQLPKDKRCIFVTIVDLYGDGIPEIIFLNPSQLIVLSYRVEEKRLEELWSFKNFIFKKTSHLKYSSVWHFPSVMLSDVIAGGSTELILSADKIYILGADTDSEIPLTGRDRGWRYNYFHELTRTQLYPYSPQRILPEKEFVLKRTIDIEENTRVNLTGDVNGDGVLELIGVKDNEVIVFSPYGEVVWRREYHTERYFSVTALDDVFGDESPEILANVFKRGHPHILIIDSSNGAVIRDFPTEAGVTDKIHDNLVYDIEVDNEGTVWFATSRDVCKFDGVSWTPVRSSTEEQPLRVFDLATDQSHNLWAGTPSGLYRFENRWTGYDVPKNATPVDFQIDTKGDVWVATVGAGVFRCKRNQLVPYFLDWQEQVVYSMSVDRKQDSIWCSMRSNGFDRGLLKIEIKTKLSKQVEDKRLLNDGTSAMFLDRSDGSLWLGGKKGLNLYNPDTGECHSWIHKELPEFLPNPDEDDTITDLFLSSDNKLWIGTKKLGVVCYEQKSDTWSKFTLEDELSNKQINAIAEDESGKIWIATPKGTYRLNPETGKWKCFTMQDGLSGDAVYDLQVVGSNVWLATEAGVSEFDGKRWRTYDRRDGLPGNTVTALAVEPSGKLWIGCRGGKVAFRRHESVPPDTFLKEPKPPKRIGIASASFVFQGRDLGTATDKFLYSYRLVPEKEISNYPAEWLNWSNYTSDNRFLYQGLNDGRYTFYLKAIDQDSNIDPSPASYSFTVDVKPPMTLINSPADSSWISGTKEISGTVSDTDLKQYRISVKQFGDGSEWKNIGIGELPQRNAKLASWDVSELSGKYQIRLEAEDELRHISTDEITVFIENESPLAQITYPTDGAFVGTTLSVKGTAMDANFSRYKLECQKQANNIKETLVESTNYINGTLLARWNTEPRVGDYIIRLKVFDLAGNQNQDSVLIHIDNTPPEIYELSLANREVIKDNTPLLYALVRDGESGIDNNSVLLEVDDKKMPTSFDAERGLLYCQISVETPLSEGLHKLNASCKDKAGNLSSVTTVFTVDTKRIISSMQNLISGQFQVIYGHSLSEYGTIELRRNNSEVWEPLRIEMTISGQDWIRMPPSSILNLKKNNGQIVKLRGVKQKTVAELLLADETSEESSSKANSNFKPGFLDMVKTVSPFENISAVGKAMWIFQNMHSIELEEIQKLTGKKEQSLDSPLIYYNLLKRANIPVRLEETEDEGIYILIDTGVSPEEVDKITSNPKLYLKENPSSKVWIPLYISSSTPDFVSAWYETVH